MNLFHTIETIFEPSLQAVLVAEGPDVVYANQSAIDLLGFTPTGMPLISFVSFRLATDCFTPLDDTQEIKRVRRKINDRYYDVALLRMQNYLLLLLYSPDVAHTTKALLQESAYTFRALTATAAEALQTKDLKSASDSLYQLDLAIEEMISTSNATLSPYDFLLLFQHAMQSFSCITEKGYLAIFSETQQQKLFVPMQNQLLHAALVGTVFDLLRITLPHDVLMITCAHRNKETVLTFSCEHAQFPEALSSLLFTRSAVNPISILKEHGSYLFRAKRIFSLHGGNLEFHPQRGDGFSISVALPCTTNTTTLYSHNSVLLDLPMNLSLSSGYIRDFFLSDLEKA